MEQIIEGYEQSFAPAADADDELPAVVQAAMKAAHKRTWKDLARERIEDTTPTIPLGRTFAASIRSPSAGDRCHAPVTTR